MDTIFIDMRKCFRCKQIRDEVDFTSARICWYCTDGTGERYFAMLEERERRLAVPKEERLLNSQLRQYGIKKAEYDEMLLSQAGVCAICHQPTNHKKHKRLSVDHDHATGKVRGLLCHTCNVGLGAFKDDVARLTAAIAYLSRG